MIYRFRVSATDAVSDVTDLSGSKYPLCRAVVMQPRRASCGRLEVHSRSS